MAAGSRRSLPPCAGKPLAAPPNRSGRPSAAPWFAYGIEREESELSLRFSLGAHSRPASLSGVRRSAAGQREVRRPAAPPVHVLVAAHHRPRATRVRIPYAPPDESPANAGLFSYALNGLVGSRERKRSLIGARLAHGPTIYSQPQAQSASPRSMMGPSRDHPPRSARCP